MIFGPLINSWPELLESQNSKHMIFYVCTTCQRVMKVTLSGQIHSTSGCTDVTNDDRLRG